MQSPAIIFIDEIDAIGTKRFDSELSGDREVQRTMLELLNQLDGFSSDENIKVPRRPPAVPLSQVLPPAGSFCCQRHAGVSLSVSDLHSRRRTDQRSTDTAVP